MSNLKRLEWADIAKGIGILMVVLYHAIIPKVRDDMAFYYFHRLFATVQMPLFFFISGWLFELKANKYTANKASSVKRKFFQLMIPYFSFSIVYYIIFNIALKISFLAPMINMGNGGYENFSALESIFQILTFQGSMAKSLWFIYVLFIIFVLNILFSKFMKNPIVIIICFFLPYIAQFFDCPTIIVYLLQNIAYFSLARIAFNFSNTIFSIKKIYLCIIGILYFASASLFIFFQKTSDSNSVFSYIQVPFKAIVAILGVAFICISAYHIAKFAKTNKALSYFGKNSFVIYLIHAPILTQSVVSAMVKLTPSIPIVVDCFAGLFVGVTVSLLLSHFILEKVPIFNTVFLGARYKSKRLANHLTK